MSSQFKLSSFKVILTFVCLAIVGIAFIPHLAIKLTPSKALPQLNIYFSMPGMSPIVVETEVTSKLEGMLGRIEGVNKIYSSSGNGWGSIAIQLDKKINPEAARFEVSTVIRQAWSQLPAGVTYPRITVQGAEESSDSPFLSYTLVANEKPIDIQNFAEKQIKPHLAPIGGVYRIDVSGANPMEWQLEYDYKQLSQLSLNPDEIRVAISHHLRSESLGMTTISSIMEKEKRIGVMLIADNLEKSTLEDLYSIEIKKTEGRIIRLKDIVRIKRVESQPSGYYRINGNNTIYFSVIADKDANQLNLATTVKNKLAEIEVDFPKGYEIHLMYDATEYLKKELNKIYFRSGFTLLILLIFVILIYRSFKYTLLIGCSLFINIAIAIIFYYLLKLEIQLYSLAGITISLTLLIDNVIIMSDQIIRRKNKKAFLAILAATITTIGSLVIIFFLEERIRMDLQDFAWVIIINLFLSAAIALFLVPALIEKMDIVNKRKKIVSDQWNLMRKLFPAYHRNAVFVYFNRFYSFGCYFLWKGRFIVIVLIVLCFGLPVFMLPDKIEDDSKFAQIYNQTLGTDEYKENIKPHVNKWLGGTWRLFVEEVYDGSYWTDRGEETVLHVTAILPHGATLRQRNELIERMENYIGKFEQVRQFETRISGANYANIEIRFKEGYQKGNFPHLLKSELIVKSLKIGGGDWIIEGVGDGFSNEMKEHAGSSRIELLGYNYDELSELAEKFRKRLLENRRIQEVNISSEFKWYKDNYQEFRFDLNEERLAVEGIQPYQLYLSIQPFFERRMTIGDLLYEDKNEQILLWAKQSEKYNIWDLKHIPLQIGEKQFKLSELATIEKYQSSQKISKENQQYRLCIQYEYIGDYGQTYRTLDNFVEEAREELPLGYTIKKNEYVWRWGEEDNGQYWLLGIVFIIIYFCSSILFNSFRQPLYIIFIIPISFIGLFLTFYLFKLNFDQGGFAAFILLSGLTVNANIYIINEYNNIRKQRVNLSSQKAYLKAWNAKVRPIFLTIISTILGFIPFMVGEKEGFWFPLAAGTIGGLIVSFIATFCFLPLLIGKGVCQRESR